jgi:uncharacterized protein
MDFSVTVAKVGAARFQFPMKGTEIMVDIPVETTFLDKRQYHVFVVFEKRILFDNISRAIIEITDDKMFELLDLFGSNSVDEVVTQLQQKYPEVVEPWVQSTLQSLCDSGLFQPYPDMDPGKKNAYIVDCLEKHPSNQVQLFVAQSCNMACIYCYSDKNGSNARKQLMTFEQAKRAIDDLVKRSEDRKILRIMFTGGEPLLNFDLIKRVVTYTKELETSTEKKFQYQIITNGTLLNEEIEDFLVEHEMKTVISLDGDEETHNRQRPLTDGGESYHLVLENARRLNSKFKERKQFMRVRLRVNLTNETKSPLEVSLNLQNLGFEHVEISGVYDQPGRTIDFSFTGEEALMMAEDAEKSVLEWLDQVAAGQEPTDKRVHRIIVQTMEMLSKPSFWGFPTCGVGRNGVAVDTEGNIFPCHRYVGIDSYILGNVNDGVDLGKRSRYYDSLVNRTLEHCGSCWARGICGGPCPWSVSKPDGTISAPEAEYCRRTQKALELSMYAYARLAVDRPDLLDQMTNYKTVIAAGNSGATR